jgi:anti-sigma factor RsiW
MNCKSVQVYLSAYLAGELCGQECLDLRNHLSACPSCRAEEQELRQLKQLLRSLPNYQPTDGFEDRLVAKVMEPAASRRGIDWNLDWRLAGGLAAAAAICAFALFQITERRVPTATTQDPMAKRDSIDLDFSRDQLFMAGNDPLSGNRFAIPASHGKN